MKIKLVYIISYKFSVSCVEFFCMTGVTKISGDKVSCFFDTGVNGSVIPVNEI